MSLKDGHLCADIQVQLVRTEVLVYSNINHMCILTVVSDEWWGPNDEVAVHLYTGRFWQRPRKLLAGDQAGGGSWM